MMRSNFRQWQGGRESRASTYFAILFGSAVITILGIRSILAVTNYPQLGSDTLHIAHMLWGGLFMLLAILIFIYLHGHRAKLMASFFAGVGFGFFIDELGKFITSDNDYFFQPAAMIIYIFFLLLWGLMHWLDKYKPTNNRQKYIDMLTRLRDGAVHGLTTDDKLVIKAQMNDIGISRDDQKKILAQATNYSPAYSKNSISAKVQYYSGILHKRVIQLAASRAVKAIIYIFVTLSALATLVVLLASLFSNRGFIEFYGLDSSVPPIINYGLIVASALSTMLVMVGFWFSMRGRSKWPVVMVWYRRAMIVNVFGVQVFLFYINQFAAAFGMMFSLAILYSLTVLINQTNLNNSELSQKGNNSD